MARSGVLSHRKQKKGKESELDIIDNFMIQEQEQQKAMEKLET